MSLACLLPTPLHVPYREKDEDDDLEKAYKELKVSAVKKEPPPYGQRHGWIPRKLEDFGDGGAFPEIHVVQYPLHMGRKRKLSQLINLKELNALMINYLINIRLCTEKASQWQQTFEELL